MNKREYLQALQSYLKGLPEEEIKDILYDYEEHFHIGLSKGKNEEEISRELGNPKDIAANYISFQESTWTHNNHINQSSTISPMEKLIRIFFLVFLNLVLGIGVFFAIFGILIGVYGMGLGFTFAGIRLLFRYPFSSVFSMAKLHFLTSFSLGLGFSSLGILVLIFAIYITKGFSRLIGKYIHWNRKFING